MTQAHVKCITWKGRGSRNNLATQHVGGKTYKLSLSLQLAMNSHLERWLKVLLGIDSVISGEESRNVTNGERHEK